MLLCLLAPELTSMPVCDAFQNFLCDVHCLWLHRCVVGLTYIVGLCAHGCVQELAVCAPFVARHTDMHDV